jgi:gas vesicle protein
MAYESMNGRPTVGFGSLLSAFLLGATAGAAVAVLTAPRSGRETRAQLKDLARDMRAKATKVVDEASETARSVQDTLKDTL